MPNAESIGPCALSQGPSGNWSLTFYTRDNVMD